MRPHWALWCLHGASLIAPALLPFEDIVEVDQGEALILAERSGLTAYDASYLWLARRTRSELVTLDGQLQAATGL